MRHALARAAAIVVALGIALTPAGLQAGPVDLEQTFYHDGNMNGSPWSPPAIDVAADGTVAVAINRTVGPSNVPQNAWYVLLYDASGEPTAEIAGTNTTMIDVAFGPDGRLYTAEGWFGTGSHIYDRAGAKPRIVPVRFFKADGAHVDRGGPRSVGVAPDFRLYTVSSFGGQAKLYVLSREDRLLQTLELPKGAADQKVNVAPDGTVYLGNKVLQADGTWKDFPHTVRDIRPDGRLLVDTGPGTWGVWDPAAARLELEGRYPKGLDWADAALGPDNHVYLVPRREPAIAYVVADAKGEIVRRRGADFDRLTVSVPDERLTAGAEVPIGLRLRSGRAEGGVPPTHLLPADNRRPLEPRAFVAAVTTDPLASPRWQAVPLAATGEGRATLSIPAGLHGRYTLKVTTAASAEAPGQSPLAVEKEFWIEPPDAAAYVTLATLRNRTGFAPGEEVRIHLCLAAKAALPEARVLFTLAHEGKTLAALPVALGPVEAGKTASAVVLLPAALTRCLAGMACEASAADRPAGVGANAIAVAFGPAVRETDFELGLHSIGGSVDYQKQAATALLHREIGATHAVHAEGSGNLPGVYLDVATRLGLGFYYRPHGHFAACNWLPNEDGPMGVRMAWLAQRLAHYPASRGITYHDLYAPFGTWWDAPRKAGYDVYWKEWAKDIAVPPTVPEAARAKFLERRVQSLTMPRAYRAWGDAIRRAAPGLARTTMQWWHQPLIETVPRLIAPALDFVTTQHAEEQYYHPVTVANMVDLWRTAGKDLWCYGNATFQEDGSGAQTYRDLLAALMRAPQGVGPNGWHPMVEPDRAETETVQRVLGPMFRLLRACGGVAAASEPDDLVAIWRSSYEEVYEGQRPPDRAHYYITTAIYTACLYGHRPAAILHDEDVLAGALGRYKVFIVSLEIPVPEPMQRRLAEFRAAGGLILANRQPAGAWIPDGAVDLGPLFAKSHADYDCNNDFARHVLLEREEGLRQAPQLVQAMGKAAAPFADCDDPTTWLSVHTSGQARYVWATNLKRLPHAPVDLHRFSAFEHTSCPTRTDIRLTAADGVAVYDIFAGRQVKPRKEAGALVVTADMTVLPGAAFAVLPAAIDRVQVAAGPLPEGRGLALRATAADRRGKAIAAAMPMELALADPAGRVRYRLWRTARDGSCEVAVPLSAADPGGTWQVTTTELLSGRATQVDLAVPEPPPLAAPVLAPTVEWVRGGDAAAALAKAKRVAIVTDKEQAEKLAAPAGRLAERLAAKGAEVSRLTSDEYLKDRTEFHWDKFAFAGAYSTEVRARPQRYDLVLTLDTPERPSSLYPKDLRTAEPRAADPGAGRAVIEYLVMPVYDTEDALALSGGDAEGLLAAVDALARPPAAAPAPPAAAPKTKDLRGRSVARALSPLRDVLGAPVWDVAASADGKRILAGLMAWGNNLACLSDGGKVLTSAAAGKYFPMRLAPLADGFALHVMENDPAVNHLLLVGRDGRPARRLAATGRQIGGTRDASARFYDLWKQGLAGVTPDGRFAAVTGSRGIAVWDLAAAEVLWRDDSLVHDRGGFAQVGLSPDGSRLAVAHGTRLVFRDGRTGATLGSHEFPAGTKLGAVRMYDGHWLILGDTDLYAFRDGALQWQWSTPAEVTAQAFAADGLRWCVGGPDGSVRLMSGGTQAAGYKAPSGAVIRLAILADGSRVAFATTTGWVGVLDAAGACQWRQTVGSRAVIAFAGPAGHTVVGDWRGFVRRFDPKGMELWATDLTPGVYRDDLAAVLTAPDAVPALCVAPPDANRPAPPQGKENLAAKATVTHVVARSGGWRHELHPQKGGGAVLNNGQADDLTLPWYDEYAVNAVLGSEMKDHPAWELAWKEPVALAAIVVRECTKQPDAVPEEVAVQVWVEENGAGEWREVLHEYWNCGVVHTHAFGPVTTKKVRYIAHGDLGRNLWTTEIEAYGP